MKALKLTLILMGGLFQAAFAQSTLATDTSDTDSIWSYSGMAAIAFSQVSLSNWAAGGENSISGASSLNASLGYRKDKSNWDNQLDLAYGLIKQGEEGVIKSDDQIDFSSKYGRKAIEKWFYSLSLNFKSQFAPGYNSPGDSVKISNFLAPAYVLTAIGMDYTPKKEFSLLLSPITGKTTIVNDQDLANRGAFGVAGAEYDAGGNLLEPGKKIRNELGGYVKLRFKKNITKSIALQTKADLFSNYLEDPQNIDVNWEMKFNMKVNKYITASLATHLIYDDDIDVPVDRDSDGEIDGSGPRTQFKEVIAIGLSYQL